MSKEIIVGWSIGVVLVLGIFIGAKMASHRYALEGYPRLGELPLRYTNGELVNNAE